MKSKSRKMKSEKADAPEGRRQSVPPPVPLGVRISIPAWLVVIAPIAVALLVRAIAVPAMFAKFPFLAETSPGFDQHTYNLWAQEIAGGDWLSRVRGVFYYAPLYPYLLAIVYCAAGSGNVAAGVAMNAVLGAVACGIAADLGRRLFSSPLAGLCSGLVLAVSGSQIAYEGLLLNDSVLTFFSLAGLWGLYFCWDHDFEWASGRLWMRVLAWFVAGFPIGLLIAGRASNALSAIGLISWLLWRQRRDFRNPVKLAGVAAFALATVLPAAAIVLRNRAIGGEWKLTTNGPINFYIGNAPGASGTFNYPPGYAKAAEEINRLPAPQRNPAWKIRLQTELDANPGAHKEVLFRKTRIFLNSWDAPDNLNVYFLRDRLPSHRVLATPRIFYALGMLGLVLTFGSWRRLLPIYLFCLLFGASLIVVFIAGRYKLPFLALLALFSGAAVARAFEFASARAWGKVAACIVAACLSGFVFAPRVNLPDAFNGVLRPNEYLLNARKLQDTGRTAEAERLYERGRELFSGLPPFWENPAHDRFKAGNWKGVIELTSLAIEAKLISQPIAEMHVVALAKLGRMNEAMDAARKFTPVFPASTIFPQIASAPSGMR